MAVQVPPEVNWLLDILCGQSWPEGDEDALRRCAQAWQEAAQGLGDLAGYLDSSAKNVLASADSMSADDYDNFWKTYIHDGDGTYVDLFKQCEPLVKQLFAQATEVEYTKIVIVVTLILTAIQIAIAIAAAAGTFGGSLAEVGLAMFIGRQTILMVVARFVEMALMMLIPDLVAQTVMFAQGHGWDGSKTVAAFENALAAGTIAAVLGPLAGKLPWMSEEAAQTLGGKFGALATHFVEGGAVNDLTALATMGTNYGLASLTGNKDWQQQVGQQFSSTNWVAQFAQGGVLADAFYFPHMFGHGGVPMTFTGSDGKSYTVYLNDAAFTSLKETGQLPADYQARVFGENGVKVGDATFNGTTISFDKPINGQSGADLGNGFTVAGHDGSQFRFQPSDQTGPDGQPQYDLVSRVQKSADPITVPNAGPGGDPLKFPPGSVVHYDNVAGPDGTMTGEPYRVEVTEGNVVKIYQAAEPGGPFELTGQVVHSNGVLRFFGADAPKYYGADGPADGTQPLATVSLVTGKTTTNDLPGYINAHLDRWGQAAPTHPAGAGIVDGTVVTPFSDGQQAGHEQASQEQGSQEATPAAPAGLVDASAFVYAQQVQQVQQMLQNHPELFADLASELASRGGPPSAPEAPREWPQLFRTTDRGIDVPESLQGLAETNVAERLAQSREDYETARQSLESKYREDIQALEKAGTSVHTLENLDQARSERTAQYQADLRDLATKYQAADRQILAEELQQVRTYLEPLKEHDSEIASLRARLDELTRRTDSMRREGGHSYQEFREVEQERQRVLARREELQSVSEQRTLLATAEKHIDDALRNLENAYNKQMNAIDAGLKEELAQRPHLDLDRIYAGELVRLDREWARAETLPETDRLRRFGELQRQLRDLEVGLSRQHEALRIGPDAEQARRWVRQEFDRALAANRASGVPRAEAAARDQVLARIDERATWLETRIERLTRSTAEGRELPPEVGEMQREVAELRRLRDVVQADPSGGSPPLYRLSRSTIAQVAADPSVAEAVREVLASLPPDVHKVPGGGRDVHAAYELVFGGTRTGPYRVDSGTAVPEAGPRWVHNAAGGVLNYLQEHGDVPGELHVGSLADRRTDAEFQIVAQVRARLDVLRASGIEPQGEVVIAASKLMCPSCQMALHELMGEFPGINVVLASGTVTVILDPRMADVRPLSGLYDAGFGVRVEHVPLDPAGTMGQVASGAGVDEVDYPRPVPANLAAAVDLHAALDPPGDQGALSDLAGQMRAQAAATGRMQYIVRDDQGELHWVEAGRNGMLTIPEPGRDPGQVLLLADDPRQRVVAQTECKEVTAEAAVTDYPPEQFDGRLIIPPAGDAVRLVPTERDGSAGSEPPASWSDDPVSRSIAAALNSSPHVVAAVGHPDVPDGFSRVDLPAGLDRLAGHVYKMPDRVAGYAASDQKMIAMVRQMPGVKGAYLFDMHGDAAGPWDPTDPQSRLLVSEVRDLLVAAGWDGEQPVILMSCDAAQGSYAADLAAALGVRVIAPTARVWQIGDRAFICDIDPATGLPDLSKPGHWEEFGGKNPGPVSVDEHGMPVLDGPRPDAPMADAQQVVNAMRALSDPRAHAPPVSRAQDDSFGLAGGDQSYPELPRVTNDPGQVSAAGEVVVTSAIEGTRPWVLEVGGHSDWLGPGAPVDLEPSDAAWPNVFSYDDAAVRLDLVRWPGRMDAVVVQNAADMAERVDVLGAALRPGGLLVLDHGETRTLAEEGSPLSIWVRADAKDVPEGYDRVYSGPDRIVLRKLRGGMTGEQPSAAPDIGRLIEAIAATHDEVPSLFPSPREIEERWGITQHNQKLIQWIVDKEDALVLMRPGNVDSAPMQEAGGVTKPPALKANTISEIDVILGARDLVGAVGFYRPVEPDEATRAQLEQAGLWDDVHRRYLRRAEQYKELLPKIEHLILERKFRVVDGVIYPFDPVPVRHEGGIYNTLRVGEPEVNEDGRLVAPVFAAGPGDTRLRPVNLWPNFDRALGVPVTGDYDMYHALDAAGEEMPFEAFKKLVDEGFMTQDQIRGKGADAGEMLARQMGIQHGAMLVFLRHNEITDWERQNIYEPIIKGHQVGGTPLLLFQAGRRPTLVYPEPVPAEPSRSPIFDALNPPGGHQNWLAAVHGPDLLPAHLTIDPADVPADLMPLTPPTGLGDLAGLVYARTDGGGVVISSDPEHLAAAAAGAEDGAFRLYAVGGGGQAWAPGGRDLSPDELFALAKEAGWDGSRPLDLVVCQGGAGDGASLAVRVQAVARSEFPDAVVRGATDWVWQDPATGERVVAPALWDPATGHFLPHPQRRGTWVRFPPDETVAGHAGAPGNHQPAAHWVHWADSTTPHRRDWPADPVTGEPLTHRDLDFLGLTEQQVEWWRSGQAPLGMTPDTYHAWIKDLQDALREDGIPPQTVDVRLLGSSARGFSGPHKRLPSDSEITERYPQHVASAALARKAQWLGQDTQRLQSRPFDAMNKLGLDEPSDYDTNISCDLMVAKARAQWEADGEPVAFLSGDHEYVNKYVARETFPHLRDWADRWSALLGREVSWAVFPSTGPKDVSASGHFVHFQDDDWIVLQPGVPQDADD